MNSRPIVTREASDTQVRIHIMQRPQKRGIIIIPEPRGMQETTITRGMAGRQRLGTTLTEGEL